MFLAGTIALIGACQNDKSQKEVRQRETAERIQSARERETLQSTDVRNQTRLEDPTAAGPVFVLRVGTESTKAIDMWSGSHEKLRKQQAFGPMRYQRYVAELAARLISEKLTEMLLYQHTELRLPEQSQKQLDQLVDGEIRRVITTNHGGVQRRFERALQRQGSSLEHFRDQMKRQMIIQGFLDQEIRPRVSEPTREELWSLFEQNRQQWRRPGKKRMSLIELRHRDFLPDGTRRPTDEQVRLARTKARTRARVLREELRLGKDFASLAKEHSSGVRAANGGAWDFVTRDDVRDRYLPVLDKLQELSEGEVSGLVETDDAVFLVRNDETIPPFEPSFTDVQPELKLEHSRSTYNRLVEELVEGLQRKTRVDPPNLDRFHAAMVQVALADDFPPEE
ncbi:MAG: peptidylprolyl isomerase [Phycisphaerae bacterium]